MPGVTPGSFATSAWNSAKVVSLERMRLLCLTPHLRQKSGLRSFRLG